MGEVGKVAIEVELLTGDLDKEIAKIEKELKNLDDESKGVIKSNGVVITGLSKLSDEQVRHYNKLVDRLNELNAKKQELINKEREETNIIKSQTVEHQKEDLHTQTQLAKINLLTARLEQMVADYRLMNRADIVSDQDVADAKVLKKDILDTVRLLEKMTGKKYNIPGITDSKRSLDGIAQATENVIKKVGRWALAVFGIRSAYMFIRQAMGVLSQYNEKIGTDIQYIRFALASALQPVIEKIIELVYKLLAYIGYIAKAWFGVDLFANASVKSFQRVNKSVKDTSKSAKELKKQLAGFDEMNILQDNGSVGSGGGGGGVSLPTQDLSDLSNIEIPDWVKWIAEHGELIKNIIIGIGQAFLTWKLVKWAVELGAFSKTIGELGTMLQVAGIIAIVIGITNAIGDLITFIADPSWNNFMSLVEDLSLVLVGLGAILVGINMSNPFGWIALAVGGLGLLVSALGKDEKSTMSVYEADKQLEQAQKDLNKATNNYSTALKNNKKTKDELAEAEKKAKQTGKELYNQVLLGIISFDDMSDTQKDLYAKYLDNKEAEEELRQKTLELQQANDKSAAAEQRKAAAVYASTGKYTEYFEALIKGYENGQVSSRKMENVVTNIMHGLDEDTRKTFAENLPDSIKDGFQKTLDEMGRVDLKITDVSDGITISYKDIATAGRKTFAEDMPKDVQKSIDKLTAFTKTVNKIPTKKTMTITMNTTTSSSGTKPNAKGAIYYPPKLAVGGIINQPGRGVPLAVGGERGAEGVIPLTDSQQMQKLGEAIGRYITVNANIVNSMNGRVISRELKQIQNEEDFAFNGG